MRFIPGPADARIARRRQRRHAPPIDGGSAYVQQPSTRLSSRP